MENYNPNRLQYNTINPKAMSNMQTLQALNPVIGANAVPNQNVQTNYSTPQVQTQYMPSATPLSPPVDVATDIMPNNNLQTY